MVGPVQSDFLSPISLAWKVLSGVQAVLVAEVSTARAGKVQVPAPAPALFQMVLTQETWSHCPSPPPGCRLMEPAIHTCGTGECAGWASGAHLAQKVTGTEILTGLIGPEAHYGWGSNILQKELLSELV